MTAERVHVGEFDSTVVSLLPLSPPTRLGWRTLLALRELADGRVEYLVHEGSSSEPRWMSARGIYWSEKREVVPYSPPLVAWWQHDRTYHPKEWVEVKVIGQDLASGAWGGRWNVAYQEWTGDRKWVTTWVETLAWDRPLGVVEPRQA